VVGTTSNPTTFAKAIGSGARYDQQVADLRAGVAYQRLDRAGSPPRLPVL
jgi:transaldolase